MEPEAAITKYMPLAKSIARKYGTLEYDDCLQEALIAIILAAPKAETDNAGAFFRVCVNNRLNKLYRKSLLVGRRNISFEQLASVQQITNDTKRLILEEDYENVEVWENLRLLRASLDTLERQLIRMRLKKQTTRQIADSMGVSHSTIVRKLHRIANRMCDLRLSDG